MTPPPPQLNRLIYGDNLLAMAALLAGDDETPSMRGKVDLIYIDPPYDSKADYRTKVELPGVELDQKPNTLEQFAYSDTWLNGTASYLEMMVPRLVLMHELLEDQGVLVVHLDWHVGHYAKILIDDIFGKANFINEVIWSYRNAGLKATSNKFHSKHDSLYFYSKTSNYVFNGVEEPLREGDSGKRRKYKFDSKEKKAKPVYDENGDPVYFNVSSTKAGSVWEIPILQGGSERLNFSTQKPEALLERVITSVSDQGALVADFFSGSGTTAAAAEKLGRRWIATDLGKPAIMITRKRLIDQDAKPFLYQAIGDYQVEQAKSTFGRKFKVGDLARTVLEIYGAMPLPPEENSGSQLGRVPETGELVMVDSPSRVTTLSTLKRAQQLRDTKMGGFKSVTVLGWNFSVDIAQALTNLGDNHLTVRVIPPDLLDRLKKKGKEGLIGNIRFSTLQYLEAHLAERFTNEATESLTIALDDYVLVDPHAINLDQGNREKLLKVMNAEPLALIEYWAIDPDYDGETFRSLWQDYRGNTENDNDPLRVVTKAIISVERLERDRKVCVRGVDVFGFESEVVIDVPVARS